jgi:ubiquinone/menaquinone biosynthesis C-methylase UbiE
MDAREAGGYWEQNADAWTKLARAGHDIYRDSFNTPAFLDFLPDVRDLDGLDIGCGEGHNTRLVARRGVRMTAIDISESFVRHASEEEDREPLGIEYRVADAASLPFEDATFDFATAFMSLMDMPSPERAVAEAFRVLRPGGFLQFSITHPCFDTPHRRNLRDEEGTTYAIEVGDYFERIDGRIMRWLFATAPDPVKVGLPLFQVPRFTRTISEWINLLIEAGFTIERVSEPRPSDETVSEVPEVQDAQVVAYFLHVRARKPAEP